MEKTRRIGFTELHPGDLFTSIYVPILRLALTIDIEHLNPSKKTLGPPAPQKRVRVRSLIVGSGGAYGPGGYLLDNVYDVFGTDDRPVVLHRRINL